MVAVMAVDLSVGSVAGLASVVAAMGVGYFGLIGGIIGGLATGIVMGLINGLLTTAIGIPSSLVTLAMMGIATRHRDVDQQHRRHSHHRPQL